MIPPRTLNGENFGNGVRYRVTECRKRLREHRTFHRSKAGVAVNAGTKAPATGVHRTGGLRANGVAEEAESKITE